MTPDDIRRYVECLEAVSEQVDPVPAVPVILSDPKDDEVFYTAVAAGADALCTRDRHFLEPRIMAIANKCGFAIMDDLQLLAVLRRNDL